MTTELQDALSEATAGDFDLLGGLGSGEGWAAELARATADGSLALLVVDGAGEGEMVLEVIPSLDDALELGCTTCPGCGTPASGFPRACPACARALPGTPDPAMAGLSPAELLDEVRAAAEGGFEVLGSLSHPGGASALYFARDLSRARIVGLALHADEAGGEHSLVVAWEPEVAFGSSAPATEPWSAAAVADVAPTAWAPPPPGDDPPMPGFPREPRRRWRFGSTAAYVAAAALGVAGAGVLAFLLVARGQHSSAGDGQTTVARGMVPAPATLPIGSTPTNGGDLPSTALPLPSPPSRPVPASSTTPGAPPVGTGEAAETPSVAPPPSVPIAGETGNDATDVEQALSRYAAAVASGQTSRIQAAYPGITGAEIDRWERLFASLGPRPQLKAFYDLEEDPDVNGDAANVVFTLTLEYGGERHPLPLRGILRRAAGRWELREVRSLQ